MQSSVVTKKITASVEKICAHLETSARQCQSLKKKFAEITFLWDQDVKHTFDDFLQGNTLPRPRMVPRPESVKPRPSSISNRRSRSRSSTSRSHSMIASASHRVGSSKSAVGATDYGFLYSATSSIGHMSTYRERSVLSREGEDENNKPSIDDFDGEISIFKDIHDQIFEVDDFVSVGWIGVNMKPAKHLVCAFITKWIHTYTSFLTKQTKLALDALGKFLEETEPVVEHLSYDHHSMESFMKLMKVFTKVGSQQKVVDYKFGAVHRTQVILEKYGYPLSHDQVQFFHHLPQRWNNLENKVSLAKQRISPHVQEQAEIVMEELEKFSKVCVDLHEEFLVSPCLNYECSDEEADPLINQYYTKVKELKVTAQVLQLAFGYTNLFYYFNNHFHRLYKNLMPKESSNKIFMVMVSISGQQYG
ncbi:dynein axonemal heavy chain 9-like [Dysidea avara]|uniref:dynein axonemal heavy chain 9-like n=1 Tax=Dysidea avara TaxID=196820 RepID=UPI0033323164